MRTRYVPPKGPTQMWFIAHTGTPGCDGVVSIDFEKCMITLPKQDTLLEPEFELLSMALEMSVVRAPAVPLENTMNLPLLPVTAESLKRPPPVEVPTAAPPPSPACSPRHVSYQPTAPPPSPVSSRTSSASPTTLSTLDSDGSVECAPIRYKHGGSSRIRHTLLTDGIICKWVDVHGTTWRELARSLGGRTLGWSDDVVRNRYIRIVEELRGVPYTRRKRTAHYKKPSHPVVPWTNEEDALLAELLQQLPARASGVPWSQIAINFGSNRTQQAIRNRASRLGLREDTLFTQGSTESS